jgi:hypothetical protein
MAGAWSALSSSVLVFVETIAEQDTAAVHAVNISHVPDEA